MHTHLQLYSLEYAMPDELSNPTERWDSKLSIIARGLRGFEVVDSLRQMLTYHYGSALQPSKYSMTELEIPKRIRIDNWILRGW